MKKIINILMALQIGTTSASFLTSCVKKYQYMYYIWVITSGGSINDKSYIQSAWEWASKYIVSQFTQVSSMTQWQDSPLRASYFEPNGITPGEFKAAYITDSIAGAKTIILPGFSHANTIGWAANLVDNVIFIDGSGQNVHKNMDPYIIQCSLKQGYNYGLILVEEKNPGNVLIKRWEDDSKQEYFKSVYSWNNDSEPNIDIKNELKSYLGL